MSKQPGLKEFFLHGENNLNKTMNNKLFYCIVLYISVKSMAINVILLRNAHLHNYSLLFNSRPAPSSSASNSKASSVSSSIDRAMFIAGIVYRTVAIRDQGVPTLLTEGGQMN